MFVNEKFGKSYLSFDNKIIEKWALAQLQQYLYNNFVSKHNYKFFGMNALGCFIENNHIAAGLTATMKEMDKWEIIIGDPIINIKPASSLNELSLVQLK